MRILPAVTDELEQTLRAFGELMDEYMSAPVSEAEGKGNFRCERCVACDDCRFCTECDNCRECTYCYGCRDCLGLTQCRQCEACERLSHSEICAESIGGSYLTLCLDCEECVQCFGCVGLSGEEFCILNEKLSRKEYFARVKDLRRQLELRTRAGWLPPWLDEPPARAEGVERVEPLAAVTRGDDPAEPRATEDRRPPAAPQAASEREPPPFPELPSALYDSGVWAVPKQLPPPPPYTGRSSQARESGDEPSQISVSAEQPPTLTRGRRPSKDKLAPTTNRASVRRGRPPPRP